MILKEKSWVWFLTFPFANNNYTTIGETLYYPKGRYPSASIQAHEEVHSVQMKDVGICSYLFLYLFAFPILWNPWRFKWEEEAYKQNASSDEALKLLRSYRYGWLYN